MPTVSIIINCYNEASYVRETLDSVMAQTFDDWEVIFWDNASSDGSGDIARSFGDRVRCFRNETQTTLCLARNQALEECQGEFIALLDADDIWLPTKLEHQVELFRANAEVGMTFCDSLYFDDGGDRYPLFKLVPPHRGMVFGKLLTSNFIFTSTMMFRKAALDQLDFAFDARYIRVMDYDLSLRMALNFPVDYVDEPLCKWRMNDWGDKAWKKDLIPRHVELRQEMNNLMEMYPDLNTQYGTELQAFDKILDYQVGMTAWHDGDRKEASRSFARHLNTRKFAMAYLLTHFIPHRYYDAARRFYRNQITSRF